MKTPTEYELEQLMHVYDPTKAHEYYERTKKLKGRKKGSVDRAGKILAKESISRDPRSGKTREQIAKGARAKQRKELAAAVQNLEKKLRKLEKLIKEKIKAEKSENRKSKAEKERAAKEKDKPKTAAEKAEAARENEKYRKKNQQKLKAKDDKSDGKDKTNASKRSVEELKSLETRVRGQIAVAKAKLAAL